MKIDDYGVLRHIWYSEKVNTDMSYLIKYPDVGFSGNPYDVGNGRTYSLDTLPLEYACGGIGDFRIYALSLIHSDGSSALDLRYKGCRIYKGKYSIEGLPAVYAGENEAETLGITLQDNASEVKAVLRYGIIEKYDIITRNVKIINGDKPVTLQKAASLCLDIPNGNSSEWIHFHGRHIPSVCRKGVLFSTAYRKAHHQEEHQAISKTRPSYFAAPTAAKQAEAA